MKFFLSSLCVTAFLPLAAAMAGPTPPAQIERASYPAWLSAISAPASPYFNYVFSWYEHQKGLGLPPQVAADPDKLFVTVDRPLAEAVRAENGGEVDEGTSYGLETYGVIDAPVATVLEALLFRWGKPVGKPNGITHPNDIVFGFREEKLTQDWGPTSYKNHAIERNGGVAQDRDDVLSLLVRGDANIGYTLIGSFLAPGGSTSTTSFLTIILLRSTADGKTDYRVAGLQNGQNYSFFGVDTGRRNFGFNASRIREAQKDFLSQVRTLRDTGKIPEKY
jgi:hypothetical protein